MLENPAWYTAYTPYQPEISQGRLEALLNFQTIVSDLTGLTIAGRLAARRGHRRRRGDDADAPRAARPPPTRCSSSTGDVFPQTLAVVQTRAEPLGIEVVVADLPTSTRADGAARGCRRPRRLRRPGAVPGRRRRASATWPPLAAAAHERGALVAVAADLLALTLLTPPGEWGADVAVGTTQRFGVPMGFGGPHAGYMAVRAGLERSLPGRLVGVSVDAEGAPAYRLALQTREQHIRREKATTNICTAQVLLAVMAVDVRRLPRARRACAAIARRVHRYAARPGRRACAAGGVEVVHDALLRHRDRARCPGAPTRSSPRRARPRRQPPARRRRPRVGISVDETTDPRDLERRAGPRSASTGPTVDALDARPDDALAAGAAAHERVPHPPGVPRAPHARPRCCATCAGWPTATSRSTAA